MKAKSILQKVIRDYNAIAHEFDITRQKPWPEFELCKKYAIGRILDVGSGNGRLINYLGQGKFNYIGIDNNKTLLKIAKKNNPHAKFKLGDALKIPFPKNSFDSVFCFAVLHHLPSATLQLKALNEMKRAIKINGKLIISVWNLNQKKYIKFIDKKTHHAQIPWGEKKEIKRFYYAFTKKEFTDLLKKAGFNTLKNVKSINNFVYVCHAKPVARPPKPAGRRWEA